ncbi:MAG: hypothetical protein GKR77_05695, partial [Legionellales bacterium]|nr:hypothetical protein [Legionellales bacterium]
STQRNEQAVYLVDWIQTIQRKQPQASIAILVQSRNHLLDILPALRAANIAYHGVDLDQLQDRPIIMDLWSLTRGLLSPQDRLAWLSVLRAPWCGLALADLLVIGDRAIHECVPAVLDTAELITALSSAGAARVYHMSQVIKHAFTQRQRQPLADWVRNTWQALGGMACLTCANQLEDAQTFFDLLHQVEIGGDLDDVTQFEMELAALFAAATAPATANVHIMTMHKAKGLEFDIVFLPHLDQAVANHPSALLMWAERTRAQGASDLILAPLKASDAQQDPIVDYLKYQEKRKETYEAVRLLYVATTRAKQQLHLLAQVTVDDQNDLKSPPTSSLLHHIWPTVASLFEQAVSTHPIIAPPLSESVCLPIHRRLPLDAYPIMVMPSAEPSYTPVNLVNQLVQPARYVGTVIHEQLLALAKHPLSIEQLPSLIPTWQTRLQILGVPVCGMDSNIQTILQALITCLNDPQGQWILSSTHQSIENEYALTGWLDGQYRSIVIDRTFVDEQGIRWIIDYKTVESLPQDLDAFLQQQRQQHQDQLNTYAAIIAGLTETTPQIHCALYFPQWAGWTTWAYESNSGHV